MSHIFRPLGSEVTDPLVQKFFKLRLAKGDVVTADNVDDERTQIKYPEFLSPFKPGEEGTFQHQTNPDGAANDKGHLGDPTFKNLLKGDYKLTNLSPNLGTEVEGIQLSSLDDQGKNDLALFLETRGLAVFRDQDFRDKGAKFAKDFASYFGPLHIHPVSFTAEDNPELLVTFRPAGDETRFANEFAGRSQSYAWHSDISFEEYPASFSLFVALEAPESGGDTVFIDTRAAYNRLSPVFQKFFETLTVIHTNFYQNQFAKLSGNVARVKADYFTEHPLVRTHPVTGVKSLYYSRAFIHSIKGLKSEESGSILNFLEHHVTHNPEIQVRAAHKGTDAKSVIVWDNRFLLHSATSDFLEHKTLARHHYRLTVLGEKPYLAVDETNGEEGNGHANGSGHANGTNGSS